MSKWLALAEDGEGTSNSLTDNRQEPAETTLLPVSAMCREDKLSRTVPQNLKKPQIENLSKPVIREVSDPKSDPSISIRSEATSPHGVSPGGRPLTYTGKVVSLDAWRQLSEWERHGPDGKHWNGQSQQWEGSD